MRARVEVVTELEIEADDDVVDELMTEDWQRMFYTFDTSEDAVAWLAWVVDDWGGPQHVDGLAHLTEDQVKVTKRGQFQEVLDMDPGSPISSTNSELR